MDEWKMRVGNNGRAGARFCPCRQKWTWSRGDKNKQGLDGEEQMHSSDVGKAKDRLERLKTGELEQHLEARDREEFAQVNSNLCPELLE